MELCDKSQVFNLSYFFAALAVRFACGRTNEDEGDVIDEGAAGAGRAERVRLRAAATRAVAGENTDEACPLEEATETAEVFTAAELWPSAA